MATCKVTRAVVVEPPIMGVTLELTPLEAQCLLKRLKGYGLSLDERMEVDLVMYAIQHAGVKAYGV